MKLGPDHRETPLTDAAPLFDANADFLGWKFVLTAFSCSLFWERTILVDLMVCSSRSTKIFANVSKLLDIREFNSDTSIVMAHNFGG